jgi:hypothetical protein
VDLNTDHLAACVIDPHGNPVGQPLTVTTDLTGPTSRRDGHLRAAISDLIHLAHAHDCAAIAIENLGFDDARATGHEAMGRGKRGKKFRRTVAGMPTARFRDYRHPASRCLGGDRTTRSRLWIRRRPGCDRTRPVDRRAESYRRDRIPAEGAWDREPPRTIGTLNRGDKTCRDQHGQLALLPAPKTVRGATGHSPVSTDTANTSQLSQERYVSVAVCGAGRPR